MADEKNETNTVRLSFRTSPSRQQRLYEIAKEHGLLTAKGKPNVSAVINFIIDRFGKRKRTKR